MVFIVNVPEFLPLQHETISLSAATNIIARAVLALGPVIVARQSQAAQSLSTKSDRTPLSHMDVATNEMFNEAIREAFDGKARVWGEEVSLEPTAPLQPGEDDILITVDTIDGTGEYVALYKDPESGEPLDPRHPLPPIQPELILHHERTTCTGASIFKNGRLWAAVVFNPFTQQLVIADRDLNGAFLIPVENIEDDDLRVGIRLKVNDLPFKQADTSWDCAVWPDAPVDVRFITEIAGQPRNRYSAISQAVDVALGKSVGAVFAGNTLHDVAPAVALVVLAGGVVAKPDGTPITLDNLLEKIRLHDNPCTNISPGFVYTTPAAYEDFMRALNSDRERCPFIAAADGWFFSPIYTGTEPIKNLEDLVEFETRNGVKQYHRIAIGSFGLHSYHELSRRDFREVRRRTRQLGGSWLTYSQRPLDTDLPIVLGSVRVWRPHRQIEVLPGVTMSAAELALAGLRSMIAYRLRPQ